MHMLVVERDPFVRAWWQAQNQTIGAKLTFALDLEEARKALQNADRPRPRCVIADACSLLVDAQQGDRLVRRLSGLGVPVLVYSSSTRWSSLARILGTQLDGCLERPFALVDALRRAFGVAGTAHAEPPPPPPAFAALQQR